MTAKSRARRRVVDKKDIIVKSVTVWAAINPSTREIMLPTVNSFKSGAIRERDFYYKGYPVYKCWLLGLFYDDCLSTHQKKAR